MKVSRLPLSEGGRQRLHRNTSISANLFPVAIRARTEVNDADSIELVGWITSSSASIAWRSLASARRTRLFLVPTVTPLTISHFYMDKTAKPCTATYEFCCFCRIVTS